jgi:hypothetical protein
MTSATWEAKQEDLNFKANPGKVIKTLSQKQNKKQNKKTDRPGSSGTALAKLETLGSISSTTKRKQANKKQNEKKKKPKQPQNNSRAEDTLV